MKEVASDRSCTGRGETATRMLGVLETAQTVTAESFAFNVVIVLRLGGIPSPPGVKRALESLRERHPLLRSRTIERGGRYRFSTDAVGEIPLCVMEGGGGDRWQGVAEEELNAGFERSEGPPARLVYLRPGETEGDGDLLMTLDHAVVDATAAASLVGELLSRCGNMAAGGAQVETAPRQLMPAAEDLFPPAFRGWRGGLALGRFLGRQVADEVVYRYRSRGGRKPPMRRSGAARILPMVLSEETSAALVRRARRQRVTLGSVLTAALLIAVKRELYRDEAETLLRNFFFSNLRPYLLPSPAAADLGSYFSLQRLTVPVRPETDLWGLATGLNRRIHAAAQRGEKFSSALASRMMMRMFLGQRSFRMGSTALSYTGVPGLGEAYGSIRLRELHAFVSNFVLGPEYTAQARFFRGRLWWDIVYLDSDMDRERAAILAEEIRKVLAGGCSGPGGLEPSTGGRTCVGEEKFHDGHG